MFVSEEKQWFALPSLLSYESLVSVKEIPIKKERSEVRKKEKKYWSTNQDSGEKFKTALPSHLRHKPNWTVLTLGIM